MSFSDLIRLRNLNLKVDSVIPGSQGPTGPTGLSGPTGTTGSSAVGATGSKGATGPQGALGGVTGATGAYGTTLRTPITLTADITLPNESIVNVVPLEQLYYLRGATNVDSTVTLPLIPVAGQRIRIVNLRLPDGPGGGFWFVTASPKTIFGTAYTAQGTPQERDLNLMLLSDGALSGQIGQTLTLQYDVISDRWQVMENVGFRFG